MIYRKLNPNEYELLKEFIMVCRLTADHTTG